MTRQSPSWRAEGRCSVACESRRSPEQTEADRKAQIKRALAKLEAALKARAASLSIGPNGQPFFVGWKDRDDVGDVCAYRMLKASNSWELRQAVARAEASGKKVNEKAVASGSHTHDGGSTWHPGHGKE